MFHLDELWDALTQGLNWLVPVLLVVLGWVGGRFQAVAGRRAEAAIERRWSLADRRRLAKAKQKAADRSRKAEAGAIAKLQQDRVGKRFVRHVYKGDVGMVGEVLELDRRASKLRVIVTWTNPHGREPHEDDYAIDQRISHEWKDLVLASGAQRHRTARFVADSRDDEDGWVEFEMLG